MRLHLFFLLLTLTSCAAVDPSDPPRLVVVLSVDQMRGDMPSRFQPVLGGRGLSRIAREGLVYERCEYAMASTLTGPGHAVLLTGAYPPQTGVTANDLCSYELGHCFYCAADTAGLPSPFPLMLPTVGDALVASDTLSRSISLAIKDRAAILMGGHHANAVCWVDPPTGRFTTSAAYPTPPWLADLAARRSYQEALGSTWEAVISNEMLSEPDDQPWEGTLGDGRRAFPHRLPAVLDRTTVEDVGMTPFAVAMLFDAAKHVIDAERLGTDGHPDLLTIGLSSTDFAGHRFGPDSREVYELYVHVDSAIADLIDHLDARVGRDKYVLIVTSDHGVAPVPERLLSNVRHREPTVDAGRVSTTSIRSAVERALTDVLGTPEPRSWIWQVLAPSIYLDHEVIAQQGADLRQARTIAASAVARIPGIGFVATHDELLSNQRPAAIDPEAWTAMRNSFHPDRTGDVMLFPKRYWIIGSKTTTHGSPHDYDRWVPLMMLGGGLPAARHSEPVEPTLIARLLRQWWGL